MAVLDGRHLCSVGTLPQVEDAELAVVHAAAQHVVVLQVEVQRCDLARRGESRLRCRGVCQVPDVASQRLPVGLRLEGLPHGTDQGWAGTGDDTTPLSEISIET